MVDGPHRSRTNRRSQRRVVRPLPDLRPVNTPAHPGPMRDEGPQIVGRSVPLAPELRRIYAPMRCLIIDDNEQLADNLRELVVGEIEGAQVDVAASGEVALRMIEDVDYDLFLTDMRLPGMDGSSVIAAIEQHSPGKPIVLLTAHASNDQLVRALDHGAIAALQKPVDIPQLLTLIQRWIDPAPTVLYIDDETFLRSNMMEILHEQLPGVRFLAAANAGAARRIADRVDLGAAVVDLRLPDDHGARLAQELKSMSGAQVIGLTGFSEELAAASGDTFTTVITKPVPAPHLAAVLERALK